MKITIAKNDEVVKEFNVPVEKVFRGITKLSILGLVVREVDRIRPPRRNAGAIINAFAAVAITDAITSFIFKKKKDEPEPEPVAECESYSEVMGKENKEEEGEDVL